MVIMSIYLFRISGMGKLVKDASNSAQIVKDTSPNADKIMASTHRQNVQASAEQSASSPVASEPEYNEKKIVQLGHYPG